MLEDVIRYLKAAIAEEKQLSPMLRVDEWRYYSEHCQRRFSKASLAMLRKDPQISMGLKKIRVLQDSMENALRG